MDANSSLTSNQIKNLETLRQTNQKLLKSNRFSNAIAKISDYYDRNRAITHFKIGILSIEDLEKGHLM